MNKVLLIILAIILPPAAVAVRDGLGFHLVLNIVLTILGWIPGIIHALYVILSGAHTEPAHA